MQPVLPDVREWTSADLVGLVAEMVGWTGEVPTDARPARRPRQFTAHGEGLRGVVVIVVDGLGWHQLVGCGHAPLLETAAADQAPIRAELPSTTVTNLAAIGTGRRGGDHGLLGYTMVLPDGAGVPAVFNPLVWRFGLRGGGGDARVEVVPESLVPRPTMFETLARAGVEMTVVVDPAFVDSGLTRAALRGGQRLARRGLTATLAAAVSAATATTGPAIAYCHHPTVDTMGHVHGPDTPPWQAAVAQVDAALQVAAADLPDDVAIVVTADHGMVPVAPADVVELGPGHPLLHGVAMVAGEPRMRTLVVDPDADPAEVAQRWRVALGDTATVIATRQAVADGWFGAVVPPAHGARLGDLVVASHVGAVSHPRVDPHGGRLAGMHGSITAAERDIPALVLTRSSTTS